MVELVLTTDMMRRHWPSASEALVEGMVAESGETFAKYGLDDPAGVADAMTQFSEETGGGVVLTENLNYSALRLVQVWPSRFPNINVATPYAHNPRGLANVVYSGRYGNRPGTDDGFMYCGHGLIQLTFRNWYELLGLGSATDKTCATGLDLLTHPEAASDPAHALEVACAYWKHANVETLAKNGDFKNEVIRVNGGLTNYQIRLNWRAKWRPEFGLAV